MLRKFLVIFFSFIVGISLLFIALVDGNKIASNINSSQKSLNDNQKSFERGLNLQENGSNGTYIVNLIAGNFEDTQIGIVKSDLDCEADIEGISRCHNVIALNNNNKITIVNPHNMENNRCLSPGDKVEVTKNDENQVVIHLQNL